jgi:hypothetical protein
VIHSAEIMGVRYSQTAAQVQLIRKQRSALAAQPVTVVWVSRDRVGGIDRYAQPDGGVEYAKSAANSRPAAAAMISNSSSNITIQKSV